jgi:hypothetical protein
MTRNRIEWSTISVSHYYNLIVNTVHLKVICAITWNGSSISRKITFNWIDYKLYVKTFNALGLVQITVECNSGLCVKDKFLLIIHVLQDPVFFFSFSFNIAVLLEWWKLFAVNKHFYLGLCSLNCVTEVKLIMRCVTAWHLTLQCRP